MFYSESWSDSNFVVHSFESESKFESESESESNSSAAKLKTKTDSQVYLEECKYKIKKIQMSRFNKCQKCSAK